MIDVTFEVFGLARPVMAYALMPDGSRKVIAGWMFELGEDPEADLMTALNRQAAFMGGIGVEVALTDLG